MTKLIIFDWGRTLFDNDANALFPETKGLLAHLASKYTLAIVSIAKPEDIERREHVIDEHSLRPLLASIMFVGSNEKDAAYAKTLQQLGVAPQETVIVDDRVVRGIAWGNHHGATTIWLQKGKFADELPNETTGEPTHTIHELRELYAIL